MVPVDTKEGKRSIFKSFFEFDIGIITKEIN